MRMNDELTRTDLQLPTRSAIPRLAAPAQVPAYQASLYQPPQIAAPSQAPMYTPEDPTQLGSPQRIAAPAPQLSTAPSGPIARAAGIAGRIDPGDSQKDMIPTTANPNPIQLTANQQLAGKGVGASGDWATDANPAMPAPPTIASVAPGYGASTQRAPGSGDAPPTIASVTPTYQDEMRRVQEQADPIAQVASNSTAPAANRGKTPFDDSQPFGGAVQIIRPGGEVTYAIPTADGPMKEVSGALYEAARASAQRNPALAARMNFGQQGITVDGVPVDSDALAGGDATVNKFIAATQQNAINAADPLAAQVRAKVAEAMGDPGIATGGTNPAQASGAAQLTGDDFLKSLPQSRATLVKMVGEGNLQVTPQLLTKNPGLLAHVGQAYPDFNQQDYNARNKLRSSFIGGQDANNITAIETGVHHLDKWYKDMSKMGNRSMPAWNTFANWLGTQAGNSKIQGAMQDADMDAKGVAGELAKVFRSSGMSEGEINDWKKSLTPDLAPAQQQAAIRTALGLMKGRMDALQEKWQRGMGASAAPFPIMSKETQAIFDNLSSESKDPAQSPAASTPSQKAPTTTAPATTATQSAPVISPAHIALLKANPERREEFDAKFGKGSAASILSAKGFADGGLIDDPNQPVRVTGIPAGSTPQQVGIAMVGRAMQMVDEGSMSPDQAAAIRDQAGMVANPGWGDGGGMSMGHVVSDFGGGHPLSSFAKGGKIEGPGTGTSDSIPAVNTDTGAPVAVSNGEYVIPAAVVKRLGTKYFDDLLDKHGEGR